MAILTPDYERLQNGQTTDFDMTQEYRADFKSQNISAAQALITSANDYLVMKADNLNDLCEGCGYHPRTGFGKQFRDKKLRGSSFWLSLVPLLAR